MIEVDARVATPQELFGDFGRWYEWKGIKNFIAIGENEGSLRQRAALDGLELCSILISDVETAWLVRRPDAKIGDEKLIVRSLQDGTFWVTDDQVDNYELFCRKQGAVG